jgi:glycosyltransferase involved in cell wall biosynthesis
MPDIGSDVVKNIEKTMATRSNQIVTVSKSMKEFLTLINYPTEKIEVCYNGCDPEKYNPSKVDKEKLEKLRERYKIRPEEKVILFVGRLIWIKGVHNLIQAMPSILKGFPKTKLVILGKGEVCDHLLNQAKKLGVNNKVVIRSEWVPEEERILHYALSDVCIFPSISEPFGIVSLEAMSMKKPVVVGASGINGLKEQIIPSGENRTGVHIDGRNPDDIAWGVKEVLRNFEEAKKWGENGRKRVLKDFTWDIAAKKTLEIYRKLIE